MCLRCRSCKLRCRRTGREGRGRTASDARLITCTAVSRADATPNHGRIDERVWRASDADSKKQSWRCCLPALPHTGRHYPAKQRGGRPTATPPRHAQPPVVVSRICSRRRCYCPVAPLRSLRCVLYDCAKDWSLTPERRETTWYFGGTTLLKAAYVFQQC